jgi:hypothetical protein
LSLPSFDLRGLLPPFRGSDAASADRAPYQTSMRELVMAFGTSPKRRLLLRKLIDYRALIAARGYTEGVQFIDGSFVENVELTEQRDPGDIDVFSVFRIQPVYKGNLSMWRFNEFSFWKDEIVNRNLNKERFLLDTYGIILEDLTPLEFMMTTIYWYSIFSHQKSTFSWKGFVYVLLNSADDEQALQALESF